ncbi:MAG: helix-turn-helix transcriptional regulator [Ruminococcaceae bacterium]|nr:helix-turn-helix transcriptional regulator [Oscillospiraceae bacterium]
MPRSEQELKETIAKNIAEVRKKSGLTQSELAEKINYSDKSVSKWERAEGLPDLYVLSQIAEVCSAEPGDFFLNEPPKLKETVKKLSTKAKILITAIAVGLVVLVATVVYLVLGICGLDAKYLNLVYYCMVPISAIVLTVFTAIWFKRIYSGLSVTLLIWSIAFGVWKYVSINGIHYIFEVAAALQVLVVLWYVFLLVHSRDKKTKTENQDVGHN